MIMSKLNKLSQEVINQIAAGEVVERPASIVKELVDNSIDADATKISVKIKEGGIDLIEISDNGYGIPRENISSIFDPHTTSKISSIEDLNTLISMGFRGEALSTITSVSKVRVDSKFEKEDIASSISFNENGKSDITSIAKETGTTVRVENVFYNIPARRKYLKSANTEYRKIYDTLRKFYLIYPNIHFILEKDGKRVDDITAVKGSKAGDILLERVEDVFGKSNGPELIKVFLDGNGMRITGYISHPSVHKSKSTNQHIFLNKRAIVDRGVIRAVMEGYSRYVPSGQKNDFVLSIEINPNLVDINVHPRKEEVRFENPYRVYLAVEEAVKHALEKALSYKNVHNVSVDDYQNSFKPTHSGKFDFSSIRENLNKNNKEQESSQSAIFATKSFSSGGSSNYNYKNVYDKGTSVKDSLIFSKEILSQTVNNSKDSIDNIDTSIFDENTDIVKIFQIFNKYIFVEYSNSVCWIIDQHACAERINFEKLIDSEGGNIDLQNLLVPVDISFGKNELIFLEQSKDFFSDLGFIFDVEERSIKLRSVPAEFASSDFVKIFTNILGMEDDLSVLQKSLSERKNDILATIACHGSIRSGQKLEKEEMLSLIDQLKQCKNAYSCPHGRPIIWKISLPEFDSHFERTY